MPFSFLGRAARKRRKRYANQLSRRAFLQPLHIEMLEERRLLAVTLGPEDNVDEIPWLPEEYTSPQVSPDVTGDDLAAVMPLFSDDFVGGDPTSDITDPLADVLLEVSGPLVGLDTLRLDPRFAGITGDGFGASGPIGVAIVDTGIDIDHPDLNFAGGYDVYHNDPNPDDGTGHGTHVAGIVGSNDGIYTGVAPGVNLYGVKVFSDFGGTTPFHVIESGLRWVISNAEANNIQVVNMSLGMLGTNYRLGATGPLDDEIAQLESMGITVVSSSGNDYARYDPIPGQSYPAVNSTIGAGAVWTKDFNAGYGWSGGSVDFSTGTDRIVSFSQRDPGNPNQLMAPGAWITSTYPGGGQQDFAGTSMASPHVAGLAALMQDAALEFGGRMLLPDQLVNLLKTTAVTIFDGDDEHDSVINTNADYFRIDAFAAVEAVYDMFYDVDVEAFPTPLEPKLPLGSLIYDPPLEGRVNFAGDTDTFTIDVDAHQTISVVAEAGETLLAKIELLGPDGMLIDSAVSADTGQDAVLQTLPVMEAGTYSVVISGMDAGVQPDFSASQTQHNVVHRPRVLTYNFSDATPPGGDGQLSINALADLDLPSEYLTIEAEGIFSQRVFETGGRQSQPSSTTISIPQATLEDLAADGAIRFTVTPSFAVDFLGPNQLTLSLSYPGLPAGATGDYTLNVILNSALEEESYGGPINDSLAAAQDLEPTFVDLSGGGERGAVLGRVSTADAVQGGLGRLFGYDAASNRIVEFQPDTGTIIKSFNSPVGVGFGTAFGLATTATSILAAGYPFDSIYELDPDTGAVLRTIPNPSVNVTGIAFLNDEIYLLNSSGGRITVLDYETGAVDRTFSTFLSGGLAASGSKLYGVWLNQFYEIDIQTGLTAQLGFLSSTHIEGIGIIGNELYVSSASNDVVYVRDLASLSPLRAFSVPFLMNLKALGADGALPSEASPADAADLYSFQLDAGQFATVAVTSQYMNKDKTYSASQTQTDNVHFPNVLTFNFDGGVPTPFGPATINVEAIANLRFITEYLTLDAEGLFEQQLFEGGGLDLQPVSTTFQIPAAIMEQLAADGEITLTFRPSINVHNFGRSSLTVDLSYPTVPAGDVSVEILDGNENVLATGQTGAKNVTQFIQDFQAPADGTYYVRVNGSGRVDYSLVVTRDATFELDFNQEVEFTELIRNGSFETGNFTGWNIVTTGGPFRPWQVTRGDVFSTGTLLPTQPQDGEFVAWNGFDGTGPMEFWLYQDVTIPANTESALLEWKSRIQWNFLAISPLAARSVEVQVRDAANHALLDTVFTFSTGTEQGVGNSGWQTHSADLTAFAGQDVRIMFVEKVPQWFTGPGQAEFDAISLLVSEDIDVPSPVVFDFEEFVPPPTLVPSLTSHKNGLSITIAHENGVLFDVERRFNVPRYNGQFDFNSISAFNGQGGAANPGAFIVNFSEPMSRVSVDMGDSSQDANDLSLVAYAGPGGTGAIIAQTTGFVSGGGQFDFDTLTVAGEGIQSVRMIGGSAEAANSVFYDNITVTPMPRVELVVQGIDQTGAVLGYLDGAKPLEPWLVSVDFQGNSWPPRPMEGVEPEAADANPIFESANVWNSINGNLFPSITDPVFGGLVDNQGNPTNVQVAFTGNVFFFSHFPGASVTDNVRGDFLAFNSRDASSSVDFVISGLVPGAVYEFFVYTADALNFPNRHFKMLVDTDGDADLSDEEEHVLLQAEGRLFSQITADAQGLIHGRGFSAGGFGLEYEGNIGGFQLGRAISSAPDADEFTFKAEAGQTVHLSTATPGDGPHEFVNSLDPKLEILNAQGQVIAGNDNGAADGRNTNLLFTPQATGTYTVRVLSMSSTAGEYVLNMNRSPIIGDEDLSLDAASINENDFVTLSGSVTDLDPGDTHSVLIDWGDGSSSSVDVDPVTRTFSAAHQYLDDGPNPGTAPSHVYSIAVTVTDDGGLADSAESSILVNNLDPTIVHLETDATFDQRGREGLPVTLTAVLHDTGTLDTHTAVIDWGDGSPAQTPAVDQDSGSGQVMASHPYINGGVYNVTLTIIDDDTGSVTQSTTTVVIGAGVLNGVLQVVGNDADNQIHIHDQENGWTVVHADLFPEGSFRTFDSSQFTFIQAWLGAGNDRATVSRGVRTPSMLLGEGGDDYLSGGAGHTILIGGTGADRLNSGPAETILIGGTTAYDRDGAALLALLREWSADRPFAERVSNVRSGGGLLVDVPGTLLEHGLTVTDDQEFDQLIGASSLDWFFYELGTDDAKVQIGEEEN